MSLSAAEQEPKLSQTTSYTIFFLLNNRVLWSEKKAYKRSKQPIYCVCIMITNEMFEYNSLDCVYIALCFRFLFL